MRDPQPRRDTLLAEAFVLCTVTDFSGGSTAIGVKFCVAVRPDLGLVFSYFWGDNLKNGRLLGVNMRGVDFWALKQPINRE